MSRVRLTQRSKQAADMSIPYPGNVNQPDRKDPDWEQYHTFEQQVNHELPDMRHDWKNDERDEIGFGVAEPWGSSPTVPTVASVRVAANKAVRIAVLLLGEKVEDDVVEAQARDLMSLSQSAMDRTLARFAETQKLYAEDDEDEAEACEASKKAEDKAEDKAEEKKAEDKAEEKVEEKKEAKKAEDKVEEKVEEKVEAKDKKAELPPALKENAEKMKEHAEKKDEKKASKELAEKADAEKKSEDKAEEKVEEKVEEKKAQDEEVEEEEVVAKKSSTDMDIELSAAADEDEEEMTPETAAQLASLFEDSSIAAAEELPKESSKKAGIKKLGGQPRVASTTGDGSTDISAIWDSAPDVSEVFK